MKSTKVATSSPKRKKVMNCHEIVLVIPVNKVYSYINECGHVYQLSWRWSTVSIFTQASMWFWTMLTYL